MCLLGLIEHPITSTGTSPSTQIVVSGHKTYLPAAVNSLIDDDSLPVTQSKLTLSFARASNRDLTVIESAPLMRCSGSDFVPPNLTSCPSLIPSGVAYTRVFKIFLNSHQVQFRDRFTSTDGQAHAIAVDYTATTMPLPTGTQGYTFPGHGSAVTEVDPLQQIVGLGKRAGTTYIRSDSRATADEPQANTIALTWSVAPKLVQVGSSIDDIGMAYTLNAPASGSAYIGFAVSEEPTTAAVAPYAAFAAAAMVSAPSVTSPSKGRVRGKTTKVAGSVPLGANGLVSAVSVAGHKATLKKGKAAVTFVAVFKESIGTHKVVVVATDSAGNTAKKTVTLHNAK
jgi:hypothetical protein